MRWLVAFAVGSGLATLVQTCLDTAVVQRPFMEGQLTGAWNPPAAIAVQPTTMYDDDDNSSHCEGVILTVTLQDDAIELHVSRVNEFEYVARDDEGAFDWGAFEAHLRELKTTQYFHDHTHILVGARANTRPVTHQALVTALAIAHRVGFTDAALYDPDQRDAFRARMQRNEEGLSLSRLYGR